MLACHDLAVKLLYQCLFLFWLFDLVNGDLRLEVKILHHFDHAFIFRSIWLEVFNNLLFVVFYLLKFLEVERDYEFLELLMGPLLLVWRITSAPDGGHALLKVHLLDL